MNQARAILWLCLLALCCVCPDVHADRIGDIAPADLWEQARRFFSFRDPSLRYALIGSILLGICCGLLGGFIVVRRMALLGDTISHAVLPGVAIGFLWQMKKDPLAIFIGATLAGMAGAFLVNLIRRHSRLKEDTALGLVLATFYAVGVCLLTRIQKIPGGNKSGIDKFLFGQAAALGSDDIQLMLIVTALALVTAFLLYKELLVSSFDPAFATATGLPVNLLHHGLMLLLAFSVVTALQAVGVVLVSAMLITPAAAAYLLTDRMHRLLAYAIIFGIVAGALGAFFSFLGSNLPTGPLMVLGATTVFVLCFLFAPRHGILARWWLHRSRSQRIQRENMLKSVYHVHEVRGFQGETVAFRELADRRRETFDEVRHNSSDLVRHNLATMDEESGSLSLTPEGWQRASAIVRNHRLWELYLTNEAGISADHVHEDAEKIEHILGDEVVRQLERRLNFARVDPHGRPIPGLESVRIADSSGAPTRVSGYGKEP